MDRGISRRALLRGALGLASTFAAAPFLAACQGAAPAAKPESATPSAAKPADAKPAATSAPAQPVAATQAPAKPAATQAAAQPAAPAKAISGQEVRLHVRTGPEEDTLNEVLPQFTTDTGVAVKIESFPSNEYFTKVQTMMAGDLIGDVMWTVNYRGTFRWANNGVIRALDDLVKADNFDTAQYYKAAWEAGIYQGKLYGMPFKIHPGPAALYYNVDQVTQAGITMPEKQIGSWDDLIKMAKQLQRESGGRVERYGMTTGLNPTDGTDTWKKIVMYVRSWGGEIYSEDGKKALFNEQPAKDAIRFMHGLMFQHKVAPSLKDTTAASDEIFIAERASLFQAESGTKSIPTRLNNKFQVRNVIMPPGPSGKVGTETIVDHIVMSSKTKAPEASWELVKLLCGKEVGIRLGEGRGGASGTSGGRLDVVPDPRLTQNPLHPIFIDLLQQAQVVRLAGNFRDEEVNNAVHQVTGPIWLGERQPDDAFFTELNSAVQAVLDRPPS